MTLRGLRRGLRPRRYGPTARWYDLVSFEPVVYRAGRVAAIGLLRLSPGDTVLVVGCGTGLDFPLLVGAVGPTGRVIGVDRSPDMLAVARRRVERQGWRHVELAEGDAARLDATLPGLDADATLFTYSLAVMGGWEAAWRSALTCTRAGGRIAVVDTALPVGWGRVLTPLAGLALLAGGVHPGRRVWERVGADTTDVTEGEVRSGHIRYAAGTVG